MRVSIFRVVVVVVGYFNFRIEVLISANEIDSNVFIMIVMNVANEINQTLTRLYRDCIIGNLIF